jgi:general secretion pathway protein A
MGLVYRLSGGVPRIINTLCDRALLGAYVQSKERVDRATLAQSARELFPRHKAPRHNLLLVGGSAFLITGAVLIAAALYQHEQRKLQAAASAGPAISAIPTARMMAAAHTVEDARLAVLPTTLEWPAGVPRSSSKALADAALFRTWGFDYREGTDLCSQAESAGLSCRTGRSGLDELLHWNRPAILQLRDQQGREFYATLTRLDDKAASFAIGNETMAVALGALALQWSGSYTLLWRSPPAQQRNIQMGERGPVVEWLSKHLALTQGGEMATGKPPVYDADLMLQVKKFQLAQGLVPDGIAGPQTLMRLIGVADQAAPKLVAVRGEP